MILSEDMMIYADNAATTALSEHALEKMMPYLKETYGNPSSTYIFGQKAKEAIETSRETIAKIFCAKPSEITFTSCGSEAYNQALFTAARLGLKVGKKHIISTKIEHHAVLNTLKELEKEGFKITLLDVDESGIVNPENIRDSICDDTCLVSVMYANNEIGTIQPINKIGAICHEKNVLFHTDAVQAAGHIKIDVNNDNIDLLSISAHKFHGPKGIGALYAKSGIELSPVIFGGAQERGKRAGTENVAAIVGMAAALKESYDDLEAYTKTLIPLRDKLIGELCKLPGSKLNGDKNLRLPGNVNLSFKGVEGEELLLLLDKAGIAASSGAACASGSLEPSHVLKAIGCPDDMIRGALRLTIDTDISEKDTEYMAETVRTVITNLRH